MVGYKRKNPPSANWQNGNIIKKPKNEEVPVQKEPIAQDLEAETDSDPIVESDTNEESGIDDEVSWPSDNEPLPSTNRNTNTDTSRQKPGGDLMKEAKANTVGIAERIHFCKLIPFNLINFL